MSTYDCYISFCEEDADRHDIEVLLAELRHLLPTEVKLHYYLEERFGLEFDTYIGLLERVHCVIVLLTPAYRRRVDVERRRNSGVYKEYERISARREPSSKGAQPEREVCLIPVLWKGGSFEESTPSYFLGSRYAADLKDFHAQRLDGKYALPSKSRSMVSDTLSKIADDILSHKSQVEAEESDLGRSLEQRLVTDANIKVLSEQGLPTASKVSELEDAFQIKFERNKQTVARFRELYFVKTSFYRAVKRHEHYIFSGRKGSGKTTLAQVLIYENLSGNGNSVVLAAARPIDVQVNDWNMHDLFDEVIVGQISGDFDFVTRNVSIFLFAWTAFVLFALIRNLLESGLIAENDLTHALPNKNIRDEFIRSRSMYKDLFRLSLLSIKWYFDFLIANAPAAAPKSEETVFRAFLKRRATIGAFSQFLCGEKLRYMRHLSRNTNSSRVLFCLDRFDTQIQGFRKAAIRRVKSGWDQEAEKYLRREVDWLHGLVEVVAQVRSRDALTPDTEVYDLFRKLDFFVVIPKDRLIEVQADMRDAIAIDDGLDVRWKPYELLTMLRKRLQVVGGMDDRELDRLAHKTAKARFDFVVKRLFPEFPREITIRIGSADFKVDFFLGVLRHTFWRPRDVMVFYLPILQRLFSYRVRGSKQFDQDIIRHIISQKTRELVNAEFIQEFSDTVTNLNAILKAFKGRAQTHSYKGLEEILSGIEFEMATSSPLLELVDKLRLLYDIGFLGLRPDRQFGSLAPNNDFTFVFMHRIEVVDFEAKEMVTGATYAIHPVFIEPLSLTPGNQPGGGGAPVLYLSWDQVDVNDAAEI